MQTITYRQLQLLLKQLKAEGKTTIKLNSKAEVLMAELRRLTPVNYAFNYQYVKSFNQPAASTSNYINLGGRELTFKAFGGTAVKLVGLDVDTATLSYRLHGSQLEREFVLYSDMYKKFCPMYDELVDKLSAVMLSV